MVSMKFYPRLLEAPKQSFFLLGPRGTGKSTWAKRQFPGAYHINLLDEKVYQQHLSDAGLFSRELETLPNGSWVLLDEVQRLPNLLNEVHRYIEDKKLRFVLCGSSARKLKTAGTNLLAGRALKRALYPFVPEELGKDFDLEEVLTYGAIPLIWQAKSKRETLEAYAQLYLKEEIQAEALVRNLGGFSRFLPLAALFHGQILSISALARDTGISRTTVQGYIEILEDTLLAYRLPAFEGEIRVREKKHPKFYWIDPGLVQAFSHDISKINLKGNIRSKGNLFEGWVASTLKAYSDYRNTFDDMYYWAPADAQKTEVDFLLRKKNEFVAIEVKASERLRPEDFLGLKAISGLKGLKRRFIICLVDRPQKNNDGIEILPVNSFLSSLVNNRLF